MTVTVRIASSMVRLAAKAGATSHSAVWVAAIVKAMLPLGTMEGLRRAGLGEDGITAACVGERRVR